MKAVLRGGCENKHLDWIAAGGRHGQSAAVMNRRPTSIAFELVSSWGSVNRLLQTLCWRGPRWTVFRRPLRCTGGGGRVSGPAAWPHGVGAWGQSADWCRTRSRAICCRRAICPPAALNIINVSYNRTIASCDSVDVVLRCPKTLGPVGLVGASEVRFLLAPRASGFKCLMWRAA